jgi:uncharacterized OB-fold protein
MRTHDLSEGVVYTETVVHSPPAQYAADAPYQLAIIELSTGDRMTVRILGKEPQDQAQIGDRVVFVEERDGVAYYRRANARFTHGEQGAARPMV